MLPGSQGGSASENSYNNSRLHVLCGLLRPPCPDLIDMIDKWHCISSGCSPHPSYSCAVFLPRCPVIPPPSCVPPYGGTLLLRRARSPVPPDVALPFAMGCSFPSALGSSSALHYWKFPIKAAYDPWMTLKDRAYPWVFSSIACSHKLSYTIIDKCLFSLLWQRPFLLILLL